MFDFELSKRLLKRLLIIAVAFCMIFSQFAVIGYADESYGQETSAASVSGDAGDGILGIRFECSDPISMLEGANGYYVGDTYHLGDLSIEFCNGSKLYVMTEGGEEEYTYSMGGPGEDQGFYDSDGNLAIDYYRVSTSYDDPASWKAGEYHYMTLYYAGKSCEIPVEVVDSGDVSGNAGDTSGNAGDTSGNAGEYPVTSMEFFCSEDILMMENTGGYWDSISAYDQATDTWTEIPYYHYYDHMNIVYSEMSKIIINGDDEFLFDVDYTSGEADFINADGEYLSVKYGRLVSEDDQVNNHWTVGSNNHFTLSVGGVEYDCTVTITPNPVKSIEFVPADRLYVYDNDVQSYDWGDEYNFDYNDQVYVEGAKFIINGTDEYVYKRVFSKEDNSYGYYFVNADGELIRRWDINFYLTNDNNDLYLNVEYKGSEYKAAVSVESNPISSIEFNSPEGVDFYPGYDEVYDLDNQWKDGDTLTLHYKGGTSKVYTYGYNLAKDENGYNTLIKRFYSGDDFIDTDQIRLAENTDTSSWTAPGKYHADFIYKGITFPVTVNCKDNDVEAIRFEFPEAPVLVENMGGYSCVSDESGGDDFYYYYTPDIRTEGCKLTVSYKDGNTVEYVFKGGRYIDENGNSLTTTDVRSTSEQDQKHWTVGTDNVMLVSYKGISCEVPVTIVENDFVSIEYIPAIEWEAYKTAGEERNYYYTSFFNDGDVLRVTHEDGTTSDFKYTYHPNGIMAKNFVDENGTVITMMGLGVSSAIGEDENSWMFEVSGQRITGEYIIKEDYVKSVSVDVKHPIYTGDYDCESFVSNDGTEYVKCWWRGRRGDINDMQSYAIFRQGDTITVTDLDDNSVVYTFDQERYGFFDKNGNELQYNMLSFGDNGSYSFNNPYNDDCYWSSDKENEIYVYYLGHKAEEPIKVNLGEAPEPEITDISDPETKVEIEAEEAVYSGSELEPALTVTVDGVTLTEGTDYTAVYENNVNAGTGKVTITGTGNYKGSKTADFTIKPKEVTPEIILTPSKATYNGQVQKPTAVVKADGNVVEAEVEMTGEFKNIGAYDVKATVSGNYTGTSTVQFMIMPADIGKGKMTGLPTASVYYDGEAKTYDVKVEFNGEVLTEDKDYYIEYESNIQPGTARVTAIGKGNFIGSLSGTFKIIYKEGWFKEGGDWYYYEKSEKVTNKWMKDSKGWCWLGSDGKMLTNGWAKDSKGYCWIGPEGYMLEKTQWIKDGDTWYYINNGYRAVNQWQKDGKGWMFLGDDGLAVKNTWKKDSKGWCYLGDDGYMVTSDWAKDSKGYCWIGSDGYMPVTTQWIQKDGKWYHITNGYRDENKWMKDSKGWCWLQADGSMLVSGWAKDSKGWCWIGSDGYMPTTTQWIKYEGQWYHITNGYRDENKWMKDSKGWCWLQADGSMLVSGWAKDSIGWCWIGEAGYMIEKDMWIGEEGAIGSSYIIKGYRVDNKTITIEGVKYTFDKDGKLVG